MSTRTLETSAHFEAWLKEHHWFADARVLSLMPVPLAEKGPLPETVRMELAYQIEGNYRAHSIRRSRHIRLVARDIREYRLLGEGQYSRHIRLVASGIREYDLLEEGLISTTHWSRGIELVPADDAIAFSIDLPAMLVLRCRTATVESLPDLVETVQPWLSERDVSADVQGDRMPTPEEWIRLFEEHGARVAWHVYGDQPKATCDVPQSDYRGWFLQDPQALDDGHQGIFFFSCHPNQHGFQVTIENAGASPPLWHIAKTILGQFKDVVIHCGNCVFSGPEWVKELNTENRTH